ncbi:MAG: ATP-dependent sacrificial sulfur transferase LarE [Bacteroidales bacterium]|nr:ATP-dependent sacrificial sulfur transferase LarE [Bacteroidales bacterium]
MDLHEKYFRLQEILRQMGQIVVAYSGGVDSAFLLKVATDTLGSNALGILAISPTYPSREYEKAKNLAHKMGARLQIIQTHEMDKEEFIKNPVNRCYFCKSELFDCILELAGPDRYTNLADGSNMDDLDDHRPGRKALKERGVRSPLQEAGLTKAEIRELSKQLGLTTWDKEALACLSSRFPYGERINLKNLKMVDNIENYLRDLGFTNIRARHQNKTLKIEVDETEIKRFFSDDLRKKIIRKAKETGYRYVTIDLEGYRQGSLNKVLENSPDPGQITMRGA